MQGRWDGKGGEDFLWKKEGKCEGVWGERGRKFQCDIRIEAGLCGVLSLWLINLFMDFFKISYNRQ